MCSQGTVGLRCISCVCVGISVLPLVTMVARTALAPAAPFSCHRKVSSRADMRVAQLSLFLPSVCLGYRKTKSVPCSHALRASSEGATRHPPRLLDCSAAFRLPQTLQCFAPSHAESSQVSVFYRLRRLLMFCCWLALPPHQSS